MENSYLCLKYLGIIAPVRVCQSAAGYYIGVTADADIIEGYPDLNSVIGEPLSRDSLEYYSTPEMAYEALRNKTWTQRENA